MNLKKHMFTIKKNVKHVGRNSTVQVVAMQMLITLTMTLTFHMILGVKWRRNV
jgi:hypothetical protein